MRESLVGADVDMSWTLDSVGDLNIVSGENNISQAIFLRITSYLGNMAWCYDESYGSTAKDWLGKNVNEYTDATLVEEITSRILLDHRIRACDVEITDWNVEYIGVHVVAYITDGSKIDEFYLFGKEREDGMVYNPAYMDTHIDTRLDGYYVKQGELVTVHCHVLDKFDKKVPIGDVSVFIDGYHIDTVDGNTFELGDTTLVDGYVSAMNKNSKELAQSGESEPGTATFTFRCPLFVELGNHRLIFKYKGIHGYNPSENSTVLHVVDRIPTNTTLQFRDKNYPYYYTNDIDNFTEGAVYVNDGNDVPVSKGTVDYYLDNIGTSGDYIVFNSARIFFEDVLLDKPVVMKCPTSIYECSKNFLFNLTPRLFHMLDIIEITDNEGNRFADDNGNDLKLYFECIYDEGVFYLIHTSVAPNCNVQLRVIE